MAIPGSILGKLMSTDGVAQFAYPSIATFSPVTVTQDTTGQEVHTFTPSVDPTLSDLACRKAPLRTDRVEDQKSTEGGGIQRVAGMFRLSFQNYVNQTNDTLLTWQVTVDGITYQIQAVETDGNNLTTRLMIQDAVPYNA